MEPNLDDQALVAAAHAEQARMQAALAELQPGGTVRISRDQFVRLAGLIDKLAARNGREVGEDFNAPVDGMRFWVPLPEFERTRAELDDLRAQHDGISLDPLLVRNLY
ncbi:hypothetical protein ASG11_06965 [Sphingomonas sp. Leaf357]|uniref:hypothetical protein n=1 Tax=Sphingomonas sp. Leaf357 TaxID=1736350 RepID=UPI0006F7BB35|nr:hypothetical protein [Sphingomonas sp. Leaf357]KQS04021.1 hypothetical protein ASG11_06965 [Sphingomonas sp. Leaf357]